MNIIAFDPSGNHGDVEGWGTTGWTSYNTQTKACSLHEIKSTNFKSPEAYWNEHCEVILLGLLSYELGNIQVVVEGYRLYENKAQAQSQSTFMTCQLIGVIKHFCFLHKIPCKIQFASEVKKRWSEDVMVAIELIEKKGNYYLHNSKPTNQHMRDSLKHAMHFARYKISPNRGN